MVSTELRLLIAPRATYARAEASASYIPFYVLFVSVLIAATVSFAATGRVTGSLLLSLTVSWMFVPLLHVGVAAGLVATSRAARVRSTRAIALLLMAHAPWSLWSLLAAVMLAFGGFAFYDAAVCLALVPIALTARAVHAFCLEVLGTSRRGAIARTLGHQAVTWLLAAVYLDRAVSLVPRIQGWLS